MICEFCGEIYNAGDLPGVCFYSGKFRCDKPECVEKSKSLGAEMEKNRPEVAVKEMRAMLARIEEKLDKVLSRDKGCPNCGSGSIGYFGTDPEGAARCLRCNYTFARPRE